MPLPRLLILYTTLLTTGLTLALAKEPNKQIELFHGVAQGNYLIGDLAGAALGTEQVLRLEPSYLPALKLKARILLDQGEPEAAMATVQKATQAAPKDTNLKLLKALILGHMDQREEAITLIHEVLTETTTPEKERQSANQLLGLLRMAEGNWDAAAAAFRENVLANPESSRTSLALASEAYLEKARSAIEEKEIDEALASINQAIALSEEHGGDDAFRERNALRLTRVRILSRSGRIESAIAELQTITGQHPENLEATVMLASLYSTVGRWSSLKDIIDPIAATPQLADITRYLQGRLALSQQRVGSARAKFEEGLDLTKGTESALRPSFHFYRGICLAQLERPAEAEIEMKTALELGFRPESIQEALLAGRMLLRTGVAEDAIPILEAVALNRLDTSTELWNLLGRAHQANGNPALALSAYNASLKIDKLQVTALGLRGSLLRQLKDLEGAAADYENALAIDPENKQLPYALGLVLFQLGQLEPAKELIAISAEANTSNAGLQLLHALLDYAVNDHAMTSKGLLRYQKLVHEDQNESAIYLSYARSLPTDPAGAVQALHKKVESHPSQSLKKYYAYCSGNATRKELLDYAGFAETPEQARKQICATAYWMAQHHRLEADDTAYQQLLEIALQFGNTDLPEYQFTSWSLSKGK